MEETIKSSVASSGPTRDCTEATETISSGLKTLARSKQLQMLTGSSATTATTSYMALSREIDCMVTGQENRMTRQSTVMPDRSLESSTPREATISFTLVSQSIQFTPPQETTSTAGGATTKSMAKESLPIG